MSDGDETTLKFFCNGLTNIIFEILKNKCIKYFSYSGF
jgi:hypothetical protein